LNAFTYSTLAASRSTKAYFEEAKFASVSATFLISPSLYGYNLLLNFALSESNKDYSSEIKAFNAATYEL